MTARPGEIIDVYAVYHDGIARKGYFSTYARALQESKRTGTYAQDGVVKSIRAVYTTDGSCYIIADRKPADVDGRLAEAAEAARERALAKLTPEDLAVLGLEAASLPVAEKCRDCGTTADVSHGPDPYEWDINGNEI